MLVMEPVNSIEEGQLVEGEVEPEENTIVNQDSANKLEDKLSTGRRSIRKRSLSL